MTTDLLPRTACAPAAARRVVHLSGELDLYTVSRLEPVLTSLAAAGEDDLVLDLSDVTFCDSSGINLFLRLRRRCASAGTRLRLRAVPEGPARVIRALGVHRVIPCDVR